MKARFLAAALAILSLVALTFLWRKTQSLDAAAHHRFESSLRELRSLDRTINQDVLRARYHLVDSYLPVLKSYRRIEQLEAVLEEPPSYLSREDAEELKRAARAYEAAVTAKQRTIESFKYRSADLKELLAYLPNAGAGVAAAATAAGEEKLASDVNRVLQATLFYNLTSDESYAPTIRSQIHDLDEAADGLASPQLKRRVHTLVLNTRRLLQVKPEVTKLLDEVFRAPVIQHEDRVASVYHQGYLAAEHSANRYRSLLYALSVLLLSGVVAGVIRLRHTAQALAVMNEKLEERVQERTRELDARNLEMRMVLDNVDQALFTVDLDGALSRERSAALDRFLPEAEPGLKLWEVLEPFHREAANWLRIGWAELAGGDMPSIVTLDQLPARWHVRDRQYAVEYRGIGDAEPPQKVLLIVSDVTERLKQAAKEVEQAELLVLFQHLAADRHGLMEFLAEGQRIVADVADGSGADRAAIFRAVHTLKGNSALYGITSLVTLCHELESKLVNGETDLTEEDRQRVLRAWSELYEKVRGLAGKEKEGRVVFTRPELESVRQAVANGAAAAEVLRLLSRLEQESAEERLSRVAEQARSIAARLGKGRVQVDVDAGGVRFAAERWAPFWASFVHMLRNALDHGIETAEERARLGKPTAGRLWLSAREVGREVVIELRDDGRGIDWEAVRSKAHRLGFDGESEEELSGILLRGGLSTKDEVTEYSGRGTGVSACYTACVELGGKMSIDTRLGEGTTFRFVFPSGSLRPRPLSVAS